MLTNPGLCRFDRRTIFQVGAAAQHSEAWEEAIRGRLPAAYVDWALALYKKEKLKKEGSVDLPEGQVHINPKTLLTLRDCFE